MSEELYVGDVRDGLRSFIAAGIRAQTCVTSPPYWGLRDYGVAGQIGLEPTPDEYIATMVDVFRLVRDVLADDGTLWCNLGDAYAGGGKGGNPPESEHQKQRTNRGSLLHAGFHEGARQSGAVDRSWQKPPPGYKAKDLMGIPWRVAFALQADGWYLRSDIIWHKPNPMPESVTDRPTKAHEYLFLLSKRERYYYDAAAIAEPGLTGDMRRPYGSPGANALDARNAQGRGELRDDPIATRNRRTVWSITTEPYADAHFAVMPTALVEPCVLAGSRTGDIVLDPFMGSGTVAQVAQSLGRRWIGCEINPAYAAMIERRAAQYGMAFA